MLVWLQPKSQPQRLVGVGGGDCFEFYGAELVAEPGGAYIAQLQVAPMVQKGRPQVAFCRLRRH